MKIAFVTSKNPFDRKSFSGLLYYFFHELELRNEVIWIYPDRDTIVNRIIHKIRSLFLKRKGFRYLYKATIRYARYASFSIEKKVKNQNFDFIVLVDAPELIFKKRYTIPVYYITDAVFPQLLDYYEQYTRFNPSYIRQGLEIESYAINHCSRFLTSSFWCANYVEKNYNKSYTYIHKINFGFCFDSYLNNAETDKIIEERLKGLRNPQLLFVGRVWERKGGEGALLLLKKLRECGINARLTIVGCNPGASPVFHSVQDFVQVYPFLDKNSESGVKGLVEIYTKSHLMVLPTKADCVPSVLIEAAQFGLPIIVNDTGGVREVVRDQVNGFCFKSWTESNLIIEPVVNLLNDKEKYRQFSKASRVIAVHEFQWKEWGDRVQRFMEEDSLK